MSQAKLIELRRDTNLAIDAIRSSHRMKVVNWPVNWADLRCIDARRWEDADGDTGHTVTISEADPCASEFAQAVAQALGTKWGNVDVMTEW